MTLIATPSGDGYFARRAAQERAAAQAAVDRAAACAHQTLAERYAALAGDDVPAPAGA